MSKVFNGNVSVVMNSKGEIALKKDDEGRFNAENAVELYKTMLRLAKTHKASINKYSLFVAAENGQPFLLANRYGNPYLALLPQRQAQQVSGPVRKVQKLA